MVLFLLLVHYEVMYSSWLRSYKISKYAHNRRNKERMLWSIVNDIISDVEFWRMFRMNRDWFNSLCHHIIYAVGEREFKSEAYVVSIRPLD